MTTQKKSSDDTKERLLDAAVELFARDGYNAVSVREITKKAGTHLSAVNYHFGDKRNLYFEVFRARWYPRALQMREMLDELVRNGSTQPEEVIRRVATMFISSWMSPELTFNLHQLIAREMGQDNEIAQFIYDNGPKMMYERMVLLLSPHMPAGTDVRQQFLHLFSFMGQILHFSFSRRVISKWAGQEYDDEFMGLIVEHIVSFTMRGFGLEMQTEKVNAR